MTTTERAGWLAEVTDQRRRIVHVHPLNDALDHDTATFGACPCGPACELLAGGWMFSHHSLDGRELSE